MRLGPLNIERALLLAPMEDVTDIPFRLLCRRLGADIVYTEFVRSEAVVRNVRSAHAQMAFCEDERPLGVQLYGGDPATMAEGARRAAELRPDLIDLNCGCWVRDVTRHGAGAALLRDLSRMERVVSSVVGAVGVPVTVKTRLGWDGSSIRIVEVARMCEAAGASALTVHCRTRDQGHTGACDYTWIPRIKAAVSIPIIVNGDIGTPQDARRIFEITGCDAVMIGRAALRNPWIFQRTRAYLAQGELPPPPTPPERIALFRAHLALSVRYLGERAALRELRTHYALLLHGLAHVGEVRDALRRTHSPAAILDHLEQFCDLYSVPA
jgi:tRNA-dihydrouridine synthase B